MQLHLLFVALFALLASVAQAAVPTVTVTISATVTATATVTVTVQQVNTSTATVTTVVTVYGKSAPMVAEGKFMPPAELLNMIPAGVVCDYAKPQPSGTSH